MMRLLNVQTLVLEEFNYPPYPSYAILSHTWGNEEISFQDTHDLRRASIKEGFAKLKLTCRMTIAQKLQYVWIDTCCIDKSSSAELSEAINSMYQWYRSSSKCLVYLEDLPSTVTMDDLDGPLEKCRWFTRGWTLQELVAPQTVLFYNQAWDFIGEKKSTALVSRISTATGIHQDILRNPDLVHTTSLAIRMSWAADRATSREEDIAYSLLGLFNINMPLLYGEGTRAFRRLQEEIIKSSNDLSIFAWYDVDDQYEHRGILADSPQVFRHFRSGMVGNASFEAKKGYHITNKGLRITAGFSSQTALRAAAKYKKWEELNRFLKVAAELDATPSKYSRQATIQAPNKGIQSLEWTRPLDGMGGDKYDPGDFSSQLDTNTYQQHSQPNPFAQFRELIVDVALKRFLQYKSSWFSEVRCIHESTNWGGLSFACPYTKMDTYKYRNCLKSDRIWTSGDLMDHLDSMHKQPLYCSMCMAVFQNIWTRDKHIRERSCETAELVLPPGISIEERNHLRTLLEIPTQQSLNEEGWYKVWDTLFPQLARPRSPLIDRKVDITMSALQAFWMDHGSKLISDFLESRGELEWKVPNEERALANLHSVVLSDLMDLYLFGPSNFG
ncbi:heterokaryon incompatibility protein-domain-containing protein [Xylaria cf. heliscus]|nr:heterokaryon incompatibility protein-domain-containing protein [Xylaria cf. heliscus]